MALGALLTQAIDASGAATPIQFSGDLDGSYVSQTVVGVQGHPVPAPTVGALQWDGGAYYWAPAGVSPGLAGQALWTNDAGAATVWAYPHGDVDASATDPGALTVTGLQGRAVSSSAPTTGNTIGWNGSVWMPGALNLAGGSGYVTGTLPTSNQASQSLAGELSGTTAAAVVTGPFTTSTLQWGPLVSAATLGTNKAGATLTLATDANLKAVQFSSPANQILGTWYDNTGIAQRTSWIDSATQTVNDRVINAWLYNLFVGGTTAQMSMSTTSWNVGAAAWWFGAIQGAASFGGANGTVSAPLSFDWGGNVQTATTPAMRSGTSATSLTVGTNKTGATLLLAGDAATNVIGIGAGYADFLQAGAPAAPASGAMREYLDSADGKLKIKDSSGNIFVLAP